MSGDGGRGAEGGGRGDGGEHGERGHRGDGGDSGDGEREGGRIITPPDAPVRATPAGAPTGAPVRAPRGIPARTRTRAPVLAPVKREPAAIVIARRLTEAVMDGTLAPGRQLGEVELAAQLGVSRGPLREAMQRLVQQGILRSEPHRGVFVVDLTPADVTDIYRARFAVESAACRIAVREHPQRTADRLAAACAAMAAAAGLGDPAALAAADMELHQVLIAEAGSPRLARMADALFVETRMCLSALTVTYHEPVDLVAEHTAIIAALRAADEDHLIALLDAHMRDALARLLPPEPIPGATIPPPAAARTPPEPKSEPKSVPKSVPTEPKPEPEPEPV